jgi:hypothetical protein
MNRTAEAPLQPPAEPLSFPRQLRGVAGYVENLPRGPRAVLRRLSASEERIPPQVFWDIAERYQIQERDEPFWLVVIALIVKHPHEPGLAPGIALARAGVSAARLERWLRLDRPAALRDADRLLSHLGDGGLDWTRFGPLLRFWTEDARRELARHFFRSPEYRQRVSTTTGE